MSIPRDEMDIEYFHREFRLQQSIQVQLRWSQRKLNSRTPGQIKLFSNRRAHSNGYLCLSLFCRLFELFDITLMGHGSPLTSIVPETVSNLKRQMILHQLCEQKVSFFSLTSLSLSHGWDGSCLHVALISGVRLF